MMKNSATQHRLPIRRRRSVAGRWRARVGLAAGLWLAAAAGCGTSQDGKQPWALRPITRDYVFAGKVEVAAWYLEKGRLVYINNCYACHGMDGDGHGPSAFGLRPPPRDFRDANFKFAAVRSGELPNDDDLLRIVHGGLRGTAMLAWEVPDEQLDPLLQFIKTFPRRPCDPRVAGADKCAAEAKKWPEGKPNKWLARNKKGEPKPIGEPVPITTDPWAGKDAEARRFGEGIYHLKAQCANCHPAYLTRQRISVLGMELEGKPKTDFRGDMYRSIVLPAAKNPYRVNIMPPDFLLTPVRSIRPGHERGDLYRLIASGVGGVMPAWVDGLQQKELWALVHYVQSLIALREPPGNKAAAALRRTFDQQPPFVPPAVADASEAAGGGAPAGAAGGGGSAVAAVRSAAPAASGAPVASAAPVVSATAAASAAPAASGAGDR